MINNTTITENSHKRKDFMRDETDSKPYIFSTKI